MGSFYMSDAVTGSVIRGGDPVVAILVHADPDPRYPRNLTPNVAPLYPQDMFRPVSLPVRGCYDDYGKISVSDDSQIGVVLASRMASGVSWDELQEKGISWRDGIKLTLKPRTSPFCPPPGRDTDHRIYGQMILHASTYEHLLGSVEARDGDVSRVIDALERVRVEMQRARGEKTKDGGTSIDRLWVGASNLVQLTAESRRVRLSDDEELRLPALAGVLGSCSFGCPMDEDFRDFVTDDRQAFLGYSILDRKTPMTDQPWLRELLAGLWNIQALTRGLDWVGKIYRPSSSAGQDGNAASILSLGAVTLSQGLAELENDGAEGYGVKRQAEALERAVAELDGLRRRAKALLRAARRED